MKIIIPMAGRGTRLRPHTLTVPKPLVPIAGKPIVERLVEDLAAAYEGKIEEIAFIIGDFGEEVKGDLIACAERIGAKGSVYTQTEKLGTAHALLCAAESMSGNVLIAFADTLFKASFKLDASQDGLIWVQRVEDPSAFGVVTLDNDGVISEFVEKPSTFVSDMAIVGIYYIKDGDALKAELQYLVDNDIKERGEYQLTNALESLKQKGLKFRTAEIEEWLDCGNKDAVVFANQRMLAIKAEEVGVADSAVVERSTIIPPCYIGEGVVIRDAVVGPYVSVGANSRIERSIISNSVIQSNTHVEKAMLENSMLGNSVEYQGAPSELSIGDYSKFKL